MACSEYHHSFLVVAEWLFLFHTSRYAFGAKKGLAISFFFTIPGSRNNIQVCWSYQQYASFSGKELLWIPLSRNYREIRYKLAAQRVVGSFGWTSVTTSNWFSSCRDYHPPIITYMYLLSMLYYSSFIHILAPFL